MIEVITEFKAKATVRIIAYVYNDAGALANPTGSIKITITDPDGEVQVPSEGNGDDDMTQQDSTTGVYEYYYKTKTSTTKGWWHGQVVVIDGTAPNEITSIGTFSFRIK